MGAAAGAPELAACAHMPGAKAVGGDAAMPIIADELRALRAAGEPALPPTDRRMCRRSKDARRQTVC